MEQIGWSRLRDMAAQELAAGIEHDAVVAKLMAEEGVNLYQAHFIIAEALREAAQARLGMQAPTAAGPAWYRDPHMLVLLLAALATCAFLFS